MENEKSIITEQAENKLDKFEECKNIIEKKEKIELFIINKDTISDQKIIDDITEDGEINKKDNKKYQKTKRQRITFETQDNNSKRNKSQYKKCGKHRNYNRKDARSILNRKRNIKDDCQYYKVGRCKDKNCRYSHNCKINRKFELCKFFLLSTCSRGDLCNYMHSEYPCKFFYTEKGCRRENCQFSHEELNDITRPLFQSSWETENIDIKDIKITIECTHKKESEDTNKKEENNTITWQQPGFYKPIDETSECGVEPFEMEQDETQFTEEIKGKDSLKIIEMLDELKDAVLKNKEKDSTQTSFGLNDSVNGQENEKDIFTIKEKNNESNKTFQHFSFMESPSASNKLTMGQNNFKNDNQTPSATNKNNKIPCVDNTDDLRQLLYKRKKIRVFDESNFSSGVTPETDSNPVYNGTILYDSTVKYIVIPVENKPADYSHVPVNTENYNQRSIRKDPRLRKRVEEFENNKLTKPRSSFNNNLMSVPSSTNYNNSLNSTFNQNNYSPQLQNNNDYRQTYNNSEPYDNAIPQIHSNTVPYFNPEPPYLGIPNNPHPFRSPPPTLLPTSTIDVFQPQLQTHDIFNNFTPSQPPSVRPSPYENPNTRRGRSGFRSPRRGDIRHNNIEISMCSSKSSNKYGHH